MAWKPLGKKRRKDDDEEGEELELVKPAPVIRLRFREVDEDEDLEFTESPTRGPTEGYRPRYSPDPELIEAELDELTEFTEDDDAEEGEDYGVVHRNVDRITRGVPLEGEEWVVREEAEGHVPKEEPAKKVDRSAAAKKAAETRRKNQLAKEKAAKEAAKKREEAAEARKRKAAAKKAAETRRKNQEAKKRAAEKAAETRKRNEAAKKAAETRRKNQLAKEKAEKEAAKKREEAAEARKRKAAAKKAAETRRKNQLAKEKAAKEAEEARAAAEAKTAAGEKEYRPQCGAITAGGLQCRNSARKNSKYCASHKGYRPGSLDAALERTDTVPRAKKAEDTLPTKGTSKSKDDLRPQCGAWTSSDKQCRNSARKGSKYCASHKGYNPRSALKRMDTAPRWKKAEDTKPSLRE